MGTQILRNELIEEKSILEILELEMPKKFTIIKLGVPEMTHIAKAN